MTILGRLTPRRWSLAPDLKGSPDVRSPGQRRPFGNPIHDHPSDKTRLRGNRQQTLRMPGAPQQVTKADSLPRSSSASRPSRPAIVTRASHGISTPDAHQFHIAEPEAAAECCREQPTEPARGDSLTLRTSASSPSAAAPYLESRMESCAAQRVQQPNTVTINASTLSEKVSSIAWTATATLVLFQRADDINDRRALAAPTRILSSATACSPVTPAAPPRTRRKMSESVLTSLFAFQKGDQNREDGLGNQGSSSTSYDTERHEIPSSQTELSSLSRLSATDSATAAPSQMQSEEESRLIARDIVTQLRQHRTRWTTSNKGSGSLKEDSRTQVRDIVTRWAESRGEQQTEVILPSPRRVCSLMTGPGDVVLALRSKQPGIYLCPSPSKMLDSITYRAMS